MVLIIKGFLLDHMLKGLAFKVNCVQTDNGTKFTKILLKKNDLTLLKKYKNLKSPS